MPEIAYLCKRRKAISYEDHYQYYCFCQYLCSGCYGVTHYSPESCEMALPYFSSVFESGACYVNRMPPRRCSPYTFLSLSLLVFLAVLVLSAIELNHRLLEVGRRVYLKTVHFLVLTLFFVSPYHVPLYEFLKSTG